MVSSRIAAALATIQLCEASSNFRYPDGHKHAWQAQGHNRSVSEVPFNKDCGFHGEKDPVAPTPASKDWEHLMNPVRNQAFCGSCHTFGTIAALEGASAVAGKKISLSEQQLVDCMDEYYNQPPWINIRPEHDDHPEYHGAGGCAGGDFQYDISHLMKGGLQSQGGGPGWCACSRDTYPYIYDEEHPHDTGGDYRETEHDTGCTEQTCHCALEKDAIENCMLVTNLVEGFKTKKEALKNALAQQPVAVNIYAHDIAPQTAWGRPGQPGYKEDVILPDELSGGCDYTTHVVTAVGYGVDSNGVEYFKIRNSWGEDWAFGGYFKVNANANGEDGPLCLFTEPIVGMYPKLRSQPTPSPSPMPSPTPAPTPVACEHIDPKYTMCCEHHGVAVVCAKSQTCGVLAGLPVCLPAEAVVV